MDWIGKTWTGLTEHGLIKHGVIKHGLIKHGVIKRGLIKHVVKTVKLTQKLSPREELHAPVQRLAFLVDKPAGV